MARPTNLAAKQAATELLTALLAKNPYRTAIELAYELREAAVPTLGQAPEWNHRRVSELVREIKARKPAASQPDTSRDEQQQPQATVQRVA